jgi:hypothetical protein
MLQWLHILRASIPTISREKLRVFINREIAEYVVINMLNNNVKEARISNVTHLRKIFMTYLLVLKTNRKVS